MVSAKLIFNFHSNLDFAYLPLTRARQRAGRPDPQKNLIVNPETAPKPGPGRPGPLPSHAPDCCMKLRKNGKCIDKVGKSILRDILINLNFHFYSNLNLTQNSLEQEGTIIMLVKHKNKSVEGPFEVVLQLAKKRLKLQNPNKLYKTRLSRRQTANFFGQYLPPHGLGFSLTNVTRNSLIFFFGFNSWQNLTFCDFDSVHEYTLAYCGIPQKVKIESRKAIFFSLFD